MMQGLLLTSLLLPFSGCVSNEEMTLFGNAIVEPTPTPGSQAGPMDKITIIAGNNQTGSVGSSLTNALIVKVTDANNVAVPNADVTFQYTIADAGNLDYNGTVSDHHTIQTDNSGLATIDAAIVGPTEGTQTINASIASGSVTQVTFTVNAIGSTKTLKIVAVGSTTPVGATGVTIGSSLSLRAILIDGSGFVKEIPATWWTAGTLQSGDLAITGGNPSKYATYTPSAQNAGAIYAIVDDATTIAAENITTTTAVTGLITATMALVPDIISVYAGNNQSATVGSIASQPIVAKVTNSVGTAVPGESVTFTVTSGTGAQITSVPVTVTTDSNGLAQVNVRAGTVAGTNTFTATMATNGSTKQTLFTLNATPGTPFILGYYVQPNYASNATAFITQPKVEVLDVYGNRVTSQNSGTVSLSVQTGTGALSGAYQNYPIINGLATFVNVAYSIADTGVVLNAQTDIGGVAGVNSTAFDVTGITNNARCAVDNASFTTAEGGCKDLITGLVWSANSAAQGVAAMTWHNAVWNSATIGSPTPEAWQVERGITKDLENALSTDAAAAAYCQSLNESNLTDWRMPTRQEILDAGTHGGGTALKNAGTNIWTGTGVAATTAYRCIISTGACVATTFATVQDVRCVRSPIPSQLTVHTQIAAPTIGFGRNVPFEVQPKIQISTPDGSVANYATYPVTLTITGGSGQLCETVRTTGVTSNCATTKTVSAVAGIATFSNLSYTAADTLTLEASSPGLTSVTLNPITVNAIVPRATCLTTGIYFMDGNGGCKDVTTGIIYSASSNNVYSTATTMSWHNAVWDSTEGASEAYEPGVDRANNDYQGTKPVTNYDISDVGYCHSLQQSGYTDWMLANHNVSMYAMNTAGKTPLSYLQIPNTNHWTGLTYNTNSAQAYQTTTGSASYQNKTNNYAVFCIRRENPSTIQFYQEPSGNTGAGYVWTNQPIVDVVDLDGAGPLFFDAATVTLEIAPASDNTGGTGKFFQHSSSVSKILSASTTVTATAANGRATFSRLSYSKPGEKFRVKATATTTWKGVVYNLGPIYSADFTVPAIRTETTCLVDDANFTSEYGGCHDLASGGLVWSNPFTMTSWSQMVWDQTSGSFDPPKPGEVATNDLDSSNAAGIGTDTEDENYCHNAHWNGFYDWRPATFAEIDAALKRTSQGGRGGYAYLRYSTATTAYLWSSKTHPTTTTSAYMLNIAPTGANAGKWYNQTSGTLTAYPKGSAYYGICVRDPNPTSTYTPLDQ